MTKLTILEQCIIFVGILVFTFALRWNGEINKNQQLEIKSLNSEVFTLRCDYELLNRNYEIMKIFIHETSDIPNEKRKAIFELKIQQDSVLMNMLNSDINTNKEILKLLESDWLFNDNTEFKSLK